MITAYVTPEGAGLVVTAIETAILRLQLAEIVLRTESANEAADNLAEVNTYLNEVAAILRRSITKAKSKNN